jgi:hypothetical protein
MRLLSTLCVLLSLAACTRPGDDPAADATRAIITDQLARHPEAGPADLYKLLHQAAMGSEHAMTDTAGVRAYLTRELATMGQGAEEPMIDTIAPDGAIVRVHLRPWVAAGRSTDSLLAAFIATADAFQGDTARLGRSLAIAEQMIAAGGARFPVTTWRDLVQTQRAAGYPAVHHSPEYGSAYNPAYRVVAGPLIP